METLRRRRKDDDLKYSGLGLAFCASETKEQNNNNYLIFITQAVLSEDNSRWYSNSIHKDQGNESEWRTAKQTGEQLMEPNVILV